jgi:hypothetical protein
MNRFFCHSFAIIIGLLAVCSPALAQKMEIIGANGQKTVITPSGQVSAISSLGAFTLNLASPPAIGGTAPAAGAFTTLSATSTVSGAGFTNIKTGEFGITIDGAGSAITTGTKGYLPIPFACTISEVSMYADVSGSAVVDVWKDTYANYPPTVADTITAAAKPTISAATKSKDTTLTGWTTSVTAGDVIGFNVDSASTITRLHVVVKYTK